MRTILIDVRTSKEFREGALPGAINLPSNNFHIDDYRQYEANQICLVCASGRRALSVMEQLKSSGFRHVSILERQMTDILEQNDSNLSWNIDRQFRLALAILLGVFLLGYLLDLQSLLILPVIIFAGLLFSVITDNCYLKEMIALLPWNQAH